MSPERAAACLRDLTLLVAPDRYLFISWVDLDVRSHAVRELGLIPVTARLEEFYTVEEGLLTAWPLRFWGLEPMDQSWQDWSARYTTVFRLPDNFARLRALAQNGEDIGS